jgi:hypothetical protein
MCRRSEQSLTYTTCPHTSSAQHEEFSSITLRGFEQVNPVRVEGWSHFLGLFWHRWICCIADVEAVDGTKKQPCAAAQFTHPL